MKNKPVICDECGAELLPNEDYYQFGDYATICRECLLDWARQYLNTVQEE